MKYAHKSLGCKYSNTQITPHWGSLTGVDGHGDKLCQKCLNSTNRLL